MSVGWVKQFAQTETLTIQDARLVLDLPVDTSLPSYCKMLIDLGIEAEESRSAQPLEPVNAIKIATHKVVFVQNLSRCSHYPEIVPSWRNNSLEKVEKEQI